MALTAASQRRAVRGARSRGIHRARRLRLPSILAISGGSSSTSSSQLPSSHCRSARTALRRYRSERTAAAGIVEMQRAPDLIRPHGLRHRPRAARRAPRRVTAETQAWAGTPSGAGRRSRGSPSAPISRSILLNTSSSRMSPAPMPAQHLAHLLRCARRAADRSHRPRAAADPRRAPPAASSETPRSARAATRARSRPYRPAPPRRRPASLIRRTVGSRVANS